MTDTQIMKLRPPIVAVLGHVDHGKTTLLDRIRKTDVQRKEAGGITQGIGASQITTKEGLPAQAGKKITFIDTPGHAAFSAMRSRGANAADIAILVVAANDGVKPQTEEALDHIKRAETPFIIAFTKVDLPSASAEAAMQQLEKENVQFEGRGGDVPYVSVSGKTGEGIDNLLEIILLVAEVNEIKGNPDGSVEAVVIETSKAKGGPMVSVVIKNGKLKVGQEVFTSGLKTKIRSLFNDKGCVVKEALPGDPVQILGFTQLPNVGDVIRDTGDTDVKKKDVLKRPNELKENQVCLVFKADNFGSLEAVTSSLSGDVVVIDSGIGGVNESDVMIAKSANAVIFAYGVKASTSVKKYAETEGVRIEQFRIIYELIDRAKEIVEEGKVKELGNAEIVAEFPFNSKRIAGLKVITGVVKRGDRLILKRDDKIIGKVTVVSLKKGKESVNEARQGEECGILIRPQLDFAIGDVLLSLRK